VIQDEKLAQKRFFLLQLIRFSGLALVMLGIAISVGQIDLPSQAGFVISLIGMIEFFFLPWFLASRWNKEDR
jgi:hypothetical protein